MFDNIPNKTFQFYERCMDFYANENINKYQRTSNKLH